ncbi:hypothetical protein [Streptomyces sp. WAC01280]|uniref:hypothetical protein n=1 Tax=Streptomyces sp. WAC01280 TaxID=2487424 RepID=UPI00163C33F9|nr:hypothetical protein [Streptomyces sp. WAC01280]
MNRHLAEIIALVDAAETRPLTEDEAIRLRNVLHGYDQTRRQLGAILAKPRDRKGEAA